MRSSSEPSQIHHTLGNVSGHLVNAHTVNIAYHNRHITLDDIKHSEALILELAPVGPRYVLAEVPNVRQSSPELRRYPPLPGTVRVALVYASPVGRMLGNAYLRLKDNAVETRLFKDREAAMAWLERQGPPVG